MNAPKGGTVSYRVPRYIEIGHFAFASTGDFNGKLRVKISLAYFVAVPLLGRPLFEHLRHGLRDHLRIFVAIVAQRILSKPSPNQGFGLGVV
jgi:hypothetical protein